MKKHIKLPTILGVLILVIGLIAGIFLINSRKVFKLGAEGDFAPKNVRISNITDDSLTITWTTDVKSKGFVKWGKSESSLSKVALEENIEKEFIHSANLLATGLNTKIYFQINSNGEDFDNSGISWQSKTLSEKITQKSSLMGSGTIFSIDGSTPAKAIVYLSIEGKILSTTTSQEGSWVIPISLFINPLPETTVVEISVIDGQGGTAQANIYPKTINETPIIIIGKIYDFRNYIPSASSDLPESQLTIPEAVEVSSRFEIDKTKIDFSNETVTLDSIDEGEIITTTNPEFFGSAPKSTEIEITIESELQTGSLISSSSGKWSWSPPANLEPGEHTITLKWRGEDGILRTLTRSFIIQAGEAPAFEATPSATPINQPLQTATPTNIPRATNTPTSVPTITSTPRISATPSSIITSTPSNSPLPESGSLTPTIGLFIMGVGVLMSSLFVWNKANAQR